jgi:hypothetical protein
MLVTVQQQLAAAKRQHATLEWLEQLTRMLAAVRQQLAAAKQHPATVE